MSKPVEVGKKIVGFSIKKDNEKPAVVADVGEKPVVMSESVARPEFLQGSTYKIKPPVSDHAMYITINDVVLNKGTEHESVMPYEIFINSRDVQHLQWISGLTLILSAIFRKGGDIAFLAQELRSVYDPNGGYFKKGGVYMNSIVAEIGYVIEQHFKAIGLIKTESLSDEAKAILAEKRAQAERAEKKSEDHAEDGGFPSNSAVCPKCHTKAVIIMDGCATCLSCGDSKCN